MLAPIGVALVHHHKAQVAQEAGELAVHRQDALVQHVGVGDQDLGSFPDLYLHTPLASLSPWTFLGVHNTVSDHCDRCNAVQCA